MISRVQDRISLGVLCGLSLLFVVLSVTSLAQKSPTCDETGHHIASGYVFLTKGDFAFSTEVPPLPRYLMALPLLFLEIELPEERSFWAREDRAEFAREFVCQTNRDKALKIIFLARLPMVLVGMFGGCFLFVWMRKYFGNMTAVFSAFFFFFSPNIAAHARLATTDIAATVFIMCSALCFWDFIIVPDQRRALVSGFFLGLALMSKFTSLLLIPVYFSAVLGLYLIQKVKKQEVEKKTGLARLLAIMIIVAFFILWAGYSFEFRPLLDGVMRPEQKEMFLLNTAGRIFPIGEHGQSVIRNFLYGVPIPLSSFIMGVLGVIRYSAEGSKTFFMGEWITKGNPFYYLVALCIKTPIPVIVCFLVGIKAMIGWKGKNGILWYFIGLIVLFVIISSRSNLQLGIRYILPVYPFVFGIAAEGVVFLLSRGIFSRILAFLMIIWSLLSNLLVYPDYLSYFNEIAGGSSGGHRYLRGSNLDWGQDLPSVKRYMDKNSVDKIYLDYHGSCDPSIYGIMWESIPTENHLSAGQGVYCISAQNMDKYKWMPGTVPSAMAGHSIYIYDLRGHGNENS